MGKVYRQLIDDGTRVTWRNLIIKNAARPRSILTLWQACHGKLPTKERLCRFGFIQEDICSLCLEYVETIEHVFFQCRNTGRIWKDILNWMEVQHSPLAWQDEINWVISQTKRKGWKGALLKLGFTETLYGIWCHRNSITFNTLVTKKIEEVIIENIIYRGWYSKKLRKHIVVLMP